MACECIDLGIQDLMHEMRSLARSLSLFAYPLVCIGKKKYGFMAMSSTIENLFSI